MAIWPWVTAILCSGILASRLLLTYQYNRLSHKNGCAPPKQYAHKDPLFGLDLFLQAGKMFSEHTFLPVFFKRYKDHGPTFQTNTLGVPTICSCEPDNLRSVFADNAKNWGVGYRLPALDPYCGKGFLTTDGKEWEHSRHLFASSFSRANIKDHTTFEHYVHLMISQIPRDGSTVDLQPLIFSLYLDTSTLFLFGESFESLSRGLSGDTKGFVESFAYSLGGGGLRMALGPLKFLHRDRKWHESNAQNHAFIEKYVDAALERKRLGVKNSENEKRPVLLDLMAEHMDDRIQLRNEATQAFVAAHETTACLISNVVFLLARHPDVQARVRDEARSIRDKPLDFDVVVKMKYLQNVINETLRLYPVFPYHIRQAFSDCILPTGGSNDSKSPIFVKAGTLFDANFAVLHRRPEIWGADAEEFRPERWDSFRPKAWEYVPFGGGTRACVGRQKALMETSYLVVRLVREFGGIEARDEREWRGQVQVTAKNFNGCKVAFTAVGSDNKQVAWFKEVEP